MLMKETILQNRLTKPTQLRNLLSRLLSIKNLERVLLSFITLFQEQSVSSHLKKKDKNLYFIFKVELINHRVINSHFLVLAI